MIHKGNIGGGCSNGSVGHVCLTEEILRGVFDGVKSGLKTDFGQSDLV